MTQAGEAIRFPKQQKPLQNLKKILQHTSFCTFCFDIKNDLLHLDDTLFKRDWEGDVLTLRDILDGIFGNTNNLLSDYLCEACKSSAVSCYAFIATSKRTLQMYMEYLTQLNKEITDLASHASDSKWKNAMIVLGDGECYSNDSGVVKPKKSGASSPLFICDLCGKDYHQKRNLVKHLNRHKLGTVYRSVNCPHCLNRPCLHERYLVPYDGERKRKKLQQVICVDCNEEVGSTTVHLVAHVNKVHLDIDAGKCEECGKIFYLKCQYKRHLDHYHDNKFECESCFRTFRNHCQLSSHVKTCKDTIKTFKCSKCPVLSETELINQLHVATHFPSIQVHCTDAKEKMSRKNKIYKCLSCDKILKTKLDLRVHVRKMHEKKPNLCLYCNKQFSSRKDYLDHVQTGEHRKNVPYNIFRYHCEHCDYAANTAIMLNAHVNRIHLNIRPFKCQYCQKCYFDNAQLKNHLKTHTGDVKLKVCDICGANLAGPTALKKHRRLHTGEKPYSCPYCEVKTNCASALKTHIMRKHMEATVPCPLCDQKFHTMNNARGHVRKTHWKSKEKFDYTKLTGLSPKDYDFFRDRRKAVI